MVVTSVVQVGRSLLLEVKTGLNVSLEEDGLVQLVLACYRRCPLVNMLLVTIGTDLLQQRYSQGDFYK